MNSKAISYTLNQPALMLIAHLFVVLALLLPFKAHAVEVKQVDIPNAHSALLIEDHVLPIIHVRLTFNEVGSVTDPQDKLGRAAIYAAMLGEGSAELNAKAFYERLESKAIQIGADAGRDSFTLSMKILAEHRDEAFTLLAQLLNSPRLTQDSLDTVRTKALSALKQYESMPEYLVARHWSELAYPDHPYGRTAMGTKETLSAITLNDLKTFQSLLAKSNLHLSVVGAITETELKNLTDHYLADLPDKVELEEVKTASIAKTPQQDHISFDVPQTVVMFGSEGLPRDHEDFYAAYLVNYMIGGGGLTSILSDEVRQKRGLTYHISTLLASRDYGQAWYGSFSTKTDQAEEAKKLVADTVQKVADQGFTAEQLKQAQDYITGSFALNLDRGSSLLSYLELMQLEALGVDYLDKRNGYFQQVTLEQANRIAKQLLQPANWIMVTVGKPNN
ncbi:MAG: insulinase family protein [Rickettsiales bacterium]|nr:insulinase family protein [Rickettsiales bacterium]